MSTNPYQSPQPPPDCPIVVRLPWRRFWRFVGEHPGCKYPVAAGCAVACSAIVLYLLYIESWPGAIEWWPAGMKALSWLLLAVLLVGMAGLVNGWLAWRRELKRIASDLHHLDLCIAAEPAGTEHYLNRAKLLLEELGRFQAAIDDLSQAVALNPESWEMYDQRADAHFTAENHHEAIADRTQAMILLLEAGTLTGEHWHLYACRSLSHRALKNWQAMLDDAAEAIRLLLLLEGADRSDLARLHYQRAQGYLQLEDRRQARREFKEAHRYDPWWNLEPRRRQGLPVLLVVYACGVVFAILFFWVPTWFR